MRVIQYRQALREAMTEEMERDERVFLMGEEVAEYNGAYKVSDGMLARFGPRRVLDMPISEGGFVGMGIGAAMAGLKPIVEFMSMSFTLVAMDQLINNAPTVRYMSGGQIKDVSIVFRGLSGCGQQLAATHSHRLEPWFSNVPGLKLVMPATPYDAKGLLKTAIRDNNPVIFMEGQSLYNLKGEVPEEEYLIPFGQAAVRREGQDLTLISYHQTVQTALDAAEVLAKEHGIDAEVLDLRSIRPLDEQTILSSVAKTHRAVMVEANWPFCGLGAQIVDLIQSRIFDELDAPIQRVTTLEVPIPYNKKLELEHVLPTPKRVVEAVRKTL